MRCINFGSVFGYTSDVLSKIYAALIPFSANQPNYSSTPGAPLQEAKDITFVASKKNRDGERSKLAQINYLTKKRDLLVLYLACQIPSQDPDRFPMLLSGIPQNLHRGQC